MKKSLILPLGAVLAALLLGSCASRLAAVFWPRPGWTMIPW